MSIIAFIVILLILALAAYGLSRLTTMNPVFRNIIYAVLIIIAIALCLEQFGILDEIRKKQVPKL